MHSCETRRRILEFGGISLMWSEGVVGKTVIPTISPHENPRSFSERRIADGCRSVARGLTNTAGPSSQGSPRRCGLG